MPSKTRSIGNGGRGAVRLVAFLVTAILAVSQTACSDEPSTSELSISHGLSSATSMSKTTAAVDELVATAHGTIEAEVLFDVGTRFDDAATRIGLYGLQTNEQRYRYPTVVRVTGPPAALSQLATDPAVVVIDAVPPPNRVALDPTPEFLPANTDSAEQSGAADLLPGGATGLDLTGSGVFLGVIDAGPIRTSHRDFEGRALYLDDPGDPDSHATHVAGTMIGAGIVRSDARGMAPSARVLGWSFARDTIDLLSRVGQRIVASNHSYGLDIGWDRHGRWVGDRDFGKYTLVSHRMDDAIRAFDLLWVKAAGNDRGQGRDRATDARPWDCQHDRDCLPPGSVAKNALIVAAAPDLGPWPVDAERIRATDFSSRGPADDGRVKPDIAANGQGLLSVGFDADDAYVRLSGTSMASPTVAGTLGLLTELYRERLGVDPWAAELRGVLLHTARSVSDDGRPDRAVGWGLMDARGAADMIERSADEALIHRGIYRGTPDGLALRAPIDEPVILTLVWDDPAGPVNTGGIDDTRAALVNDLDVRARSSDRTYYPWRFAVGDADAEPIADGPNRRDNVERIVIPAGSRSSELVQVTVELSGSLADDAPQPYVLIASHPYTEVESEPILGAQRVLRVRLQNDGDPETLPLPISVVGEGSIAYAIERVDAPSWLSLDRTEGVLPDDTPDATVDATGLSPSLHYATLRVAPTGSDTPPRLVTIIADVRGLDFPVVDAGVDRTVRSNAFVRLNGSGRDPAGDEVTYAWRQTAGPPVELARPTSARPGFVAPSVDSPTTLRFDLVVTSGALSSAPDAVEVDVLPSVESDRETLAGNRCATAPLVRLPFSTTDDLDPSHDVDFYRFIADAGETVVSRTFRRGASLDTTLGLVDTDEALLDTDDDGGSDVYSQLRAVLPGAGEGSWCVAVSSFPDLSFDGGTTEARGSYGLTIELDRPNVDPVADAGDDLAVEAGETVVLDGSRSHDPDGFTLGYRWAVASGPESIELRDEAGPTPSFFAPTELDEALTIELELTVFDADAATARDAVSVTVSAGSSPLPLADAGRDLRVAQGARVSLTGVARTAGGDATVTWEQASGAAIESFRVDGASATFVLPDTDDDGETRTFSWRVNEDGRTATDEISVTAVETTGRDEPENNRCETAPLLGDSAILPIRERVAAELSPRHDVDFYRFPVLEGTAFVFEVVPNGPSIDTTLGIFRVLEDGVELRAVDDDGGEGTYSRIEAASAADGMLCVAVSHFRDMTFDGGGADAGGPYILDVTVTPPAGVNDPPTAAAGEDRAVEPGALVELDGTASSDPEGAPLTFRWAQIGGDEIVDLLGEDDAIAQFIAPADRPEETRLVFELAVHDGAFEDRDTVELTVGANRPPTLAPVARREVAVGDEVSFVLDADDPDGDAVEVIAEELPPGATFDAETLTFRWAPEAGGFFTPRFEARDVFGATAVVFATIIAIDREAENRPPVLEPLEDRRIVTETTPVIVELAASAEDPDGDELEYFWQLSDGTFLGVTPAVSVELDYGGHRVELFVSDGEASATSAANIEVVSPEPTRPIARVVETQRLRADDEVEATLDGRSSDDPLGRAIVDYRWIQLSGPEAGIDPVGPGLATFNRPTDAEGIAFELRVAVLDEGERVESEPARTEIFFGETENRRPTAAIAGPTDAVRGEVIELSGEVSVDDDGDPLTYRWSAVSGEATVRNPTSSIASFELGEPTEDGRWGIALVVSDGVALSAPTLLEIEDRGTSRNRPPSARARLNGVPRQGAMVELDASGSTDPDGDELTFSWRQMDGPNASLDATTEAIARVELDVPAGSELRFEVTVSDGRRTDVRSLSFVVLEGDDVAEPAPDASAGSDATGEDDAAVDGDGGMGDATDVSMGEADTSDSGGGGGGGCSVAHSGAPTLPVAAWIAAAFFVFARRRQPPTARCIRQTGRGASLAPWTVLCLLLAACAEPAKQGTDEADVWTAPDARRTGGICVGVDTVPPPQACEEPDPDEPRADCLECGGVCLAPVVNETSWSDERLEEEWTYHTTGHALDVLRAEPFTHAAPLDAGAEAFRSWQEQAYGVFLRALRVDAAEWPDLSPMARVLETTPFEGYERRKIDYLVEPGLRVPAFLFVPTGADIETGSRAGIVLWHGHGDVGKDAVAGIPPHTEEENYQHAAARRMAELGYVVLAPDVRSFGETGSWKQHQHYTSQLLLHGRVALGVFLADAWRAVDVLESVPEVDPGRIGTAGTSLGGQISVYLAATDPRIKATVVQGYLASHRGTHLSYLHCVCQYMPLMGRTMDISDAALLAAPRPIRFVVGELDLLFSLDEARPQFERIEAGYELAGAADSASLVSHPGGHEWIQQPAVDWFSEHLGGP